MENISIKLISKIDDVKNLEKEWNFLLAHSYTNTIFQTFEWNYYFLKDIVEETPDKKILLILAYQQDELIGIAPLYKYKKLTKFIGHDLSDYSDFIICEKYKKEVLDKIFNYLKENKLDNLKLMDLPKGSYTLEHIKKECQKYLITQLEDTHKFLIKDKEQALKHFQECQNEYESKFKRFRKFINSEHFSFEVASNLEEYKKALSKFIEFHQKRWNTTSTPSKFSYKDKNNFYADCFKELFKKDILKLFIVKYDEDIIACEIFLIWNNIYYSYMGAFDSNHRKISPNKANFISNRKEIINSGGKIIDLGRGDEKYKNDLSNHREENYEVNYRTNFLVYIDEWVYSKLRNWLIQNQKIYWKVKGIKELLMSTLNSILRKGSHKD